MAASGAARTWPSPAPPRSTSPSTSRSASKTRCGTTARWTCSCSGSRTCFLPYAAHGRMGGFGGNDYNILLLELGLTPEQAMKNYTATIANAIANGVEKLIALGAVDVVVPNLLPTGCLPLFMSLFGSATDEAGFDQYGCIRSFNRLTEYHNSMLRRQVQVLQGKHPSARIMYADYYAQVIRMVQRPQEFGFSNPLEACCGAGGDKYNFDVGARCGMPGATACRNPSARLSWDGVHPTEAANKMIADAWLHGPYCTPPILS